MNPERKEILTLPCLPGRLGFEPDHIPILANAWPETRVLDFLLILVLESNGKSRTTDENEDDLIPAVSVQTLLTDWKTGVRFGVRFGLNTS